jgi:hypothetical protein
MTTLLVFAGIAVLVVAYLAFDWWWAGHKASRRLVSARDHNGENANVGYTLVERNMNSIDQQGGFGI